MIGVEDPFSAGGPSPGGGALPGTDGTSGAGQDATAGSGVGDEGFAPSTGDPANATAVPDGDDGQSTGGAALDDEGDEGDEGDEDDAGTTMLTTAAGSTDDGAMGSSSAAGDDDDGAAAGSCATVAVENLIASSFSDCGDDARIGQFGFAAGVTCSQVCCMFGFDSCVHQAAQSNPSLCTPEGAPIIGDCNEVFPNNWMYQCLCA